MKRNAAAICTLLTFLGAGPALGDHSWGDYHWARTSTTFDLTVVKSTTSDWDPYVTQALADWSASTTLNLVEEPGGSTSRKVRRQCRPEDGQVRVCNLDYGANGWLGVAGITIDSNDHILRGYTKLNDTYFDASFYDNDAWRQSVTCQELGHDIGLDHQDEHFDNESLLSCMDYQNPPFPYPNAHDYEELDRIYRHLDGYDSYSGDPAPVDSSGDGSGGGCNAPPGKGCNKQGVRGGGEVGWGMSLGRRGQSEVFLRIDRDGTRHVTHVFWASGH